MSYSGKFKDKNNNLHPVTSVLYGTCDTAAATAAKVVTCTDFDTLMTGVTIRVKFANANTAASPTVNINSTGAKSVYRFGSTAPVDGNSWNAGEVVELVYDGTSFFMTGADDIAAKQNATDNSLDTEAKTIVGAINEHEGDIGSLKSGLTDLSDHVDGSATTYPYADVITINDAVPSNLADCNVKIEPVQDLHGYDKPWVGGAGKNKCAGTYTTTTNGGVTFTAQSDGTVRATDTSTGYAYVNSSEFTIKAGTYTFSGAPSGNTKYVLAIYSGATLVSQISNGTETDVTFESDTNIVVRCVVNGADVATGVTYKPMLRLSTESDSTFAPYTNICPISGHTEASVQRDGKNLYSGGESGMINQGTGEDEPSGTVTRSYFINVGGGNSIALSHFDATSSGVRVFYYGKNKVYMTSQVFNFDANNSIIVSRPNGCEWIRFQASNSVFSPTTTVQVELGSTATPYEPYAGKTYTLALGDTIYGGTVDFDSGVMTVDRAIIEYDGSVDENWNKFGTGSASEYCMYIAEPNNYRQIIGQIVPNIKSNYLSAIAQSSTWGDYDAFISNTSREGTSNRVLCTGIKSITTVEAWKTYLQSNPLQVCYELNTPTTIQLTPTQIQLLQGTNTLYASTGDISVTVNGVSGAIGSVQAQANATDNALAQLAADLAEQLPTAPTTDGAYVLTVTVADGTPTYSWESAT